jgi:hypothetical protein
VVCDLLCHPALVAGSPSRFALSSRTCCGIAISFCPVIPHLLRDHRLVLPCHPGLVPGSPSRFIKKMNYFICIIDLFEIFKILQKSLNFNKNNIFLSLNY